MHRRMVCRLTLIAVAVCMLAACSSIALQTSGQGDCTPEPLNSDLATVTGVYILPDDGRRPLLDEIERASCSIDVTSYLISDDDIIEALGRADARGVTVRVIYEETPFGGFGGQVEVAEELARYGVEVRTGRSEFRFTHAKYVLIDDQVGIITNQNLTFSAFEQNREFGAITTRPNTVASLADIFDADWNGSQAPDAVPELVISPQNARSALIRLIDSADTELRLYAEVIRDDQIVAALGQAVERGVVVRVVVNEPDDDLDFDAYGRLSSAGVEIRVANHIYIHAKAMVIDDTRVLVGSHNPTATSLDDNREVSLVVENAVAVERVTATFERDWIRSVPWNARSMWDNRAAPLALDMSIVYGYRVRTVPMGLARVNRRQGQVSELRGEDTNVTLRVR